MATNQLAGEAEEEEEEVAPSGARDLLMTLPGMTMDVADAILDWIDEDDVPREFGVESEYYTTLSPPYAPRNGPLITVEELLLVRGVTPQLLFGMDQNRNGVVDPHEMGGAMATGGGLAVNAQADGALGSLDRGWSAYFTLNSMEKNANALGEPRIDLNGEDLQALFDELSLALGEEQATFIVAYRLSGPYDGDETGTAASGTLDLSGQGQTRITSILDLIDVKVQVQFADDDEATILAPAFPLDGAGDYLPTLMDNVTINPSPTIPGRININHAPRSTLLGIPGMPEEVVEEIISRRSGVDPAAPPDPNWEHETWPLVEGIVTLDQMKMLAPFICGGGDVYRAQVVGYYQDGQASARTEVIVDATGESPRVVLWRDISHLGRGYPLGVLGVAMQ
jgi:type II secretory pathway component PulK